MLACNTGGDSTGTAADTTVGAATATTTGAGDDGFGEAACAVAGVACESPVDCCASAPPGSGCPNTFPLSFTCEAGTCVQGGCTTQADCADLYTGFSCITVGSKGFCVAACEGDQDCIVDHNMPGTVCIDNAGGDFCREP